MGPGVIVTKYVSCAPILNQFIFIINFLGDECPLPLWCEHILLLNTFLLCMFILLLSYIINLNLCLLTIIIT